MSSGNFLVQNQPEFGPKEGFDFDPPTEGFDSSLIGAEREEPRTGGLDILVKNLPGVKIQGYYENKYPMATFLYHKTDAAGNFETAPRTVLVTGIYQGEHPDHAGQGDDIYLHGVQVNDPRDEAGLLFPMMDGPTALANTKNFAVSSIYATGKTLTDARTGMRQFIPAKPSEY